MAKVFFNQRLNFTIQGEIWRAKNGATRRDLKLINKVSSDKNVDFIEAQLGKLDKGNHSFIFINEPKKSDNRILGVFLNSEYAYDVVEGKEIFSNYSSGGPGNSCSQFGIYELGTLLKVHTYKNRRPASYYRLTEEGWQYIENHEVEQSEMEDI